MKDSLPTTIVIFGGSGDLARRKLVPGLFSLYQKGRLPENTRVIGYSRSDYSDDEYRAFLRGHAEKFAKVWNADQWAEFEPKLSYVSGVFDDDKAFDRLKIAVLDGDGNLGNCLYYMSIAPRFFTSVAQQLHEHGMVQKSDAGFKRVIVEKPFGHDLESAKQLNRDLHSYLEEDQIYRIDHYLAKETVQNIMVFRFANTIFEPLWNRNFIDHVQITATESVDVGTRAGYYDSAGVLRDMFQNHLMQLLALTAMEPPASFEADAVRNEKVKVLQSLRPITHSRLGTQTVRAQYEGYLDAEGIADGSQTPTYAALKVYIDNWRWKDVPFYLRSGKGLKAKATEIIIQFKKPPHMMFPISDDYVISSNYLAICIQPHEGIHLRFEAKVPDTDSNMESVLMDFHYSDEFGEIVMPQAYEKLLLEALEGDATLFTRSDGIEAAWEFMDRVIRGFETEYAPRMATYKKGSWGPDVADELLNRSRRKWRHGCAEHE